jgi:signal transduction histidine kinase
MLIADNMQKPEFPKRNFRENINTIQLHTRYFDKIIRNFEIVADRANPPELKLQPVKLQTIINRCLQLLTIVNRTILPDNFILLPKIKGDEDRIEQVFVSLLDNARKYSTNESGKIHIKCGYTDNMVSVSIINEGPFINEADRERIIKLGERTEEARSITTTGSGIGLTAVTIVMDQHRGKLEISSTPIDDKAENTFTVIFPREG